jgi:secretion/DNA translocation related TadE-like protein
MFAAALAMVLVMAATIAILVATAMLAGHRARAAADLAALAGATAAADGLDACRTAQSVAGANGAVLTSCRLVGTPTSFVVSVTAAVRTGLRSPLPDAVHADAKAGNVPG